MVVSKPVEPPERFWVGQVPYSEFQAMRAVRMDWARAATSDFLADLRAPLMAGTARPARFTLSPLVPLARCP